MRERTIMHDRKVRAAIIGPGNIGTDLLCKLMRSSVVEPIWMVGVDPGSVGLDRARQFGISTTDQGVRGLLPHVKEDRIQLAFDATSASAHQVTSDLLMRADVFIIDLTPAAIGPFCIPPVNLNACLATGVQNLNMVTCGGQATIPIVAAISSVQTVEFGEIVATVASKSAGPGTRKNIDEFTRTTASAIERVGGARQGKAIIIINPAEPPLIMRDTVHCLTRDDPDRDRISAAISAMVREVQQYVPGYRVINGPVFDGKRVSVYLQVEGLGDFLPKYSGNLDIMTAAAVRAGEMVATALRTPNPAIAGVA
jgi:acetaldehyde/propanal dehydrogenase